MVISAFGGLMLGGLACLVPRDLQTADALMLLAGWCLLGTLHGQFLWPIIQHKPWWTTSVVQYAALAGMFIAGVARTTGPGTFWIPLAAMWLGLLACWRFAPDTLAPGTCRTCGYDLRLLPLPRCPECGTAFTPVTTSTVRHSGSPA